MELCETDLEMELGLDYDLIDIAKPVLRPESEILEYIKQVALGIQHLHENNIIHRDVKPANLLLLDGNVKLGDFGFSTKYDPTEVTHRIGTPLYWAPEQIKEEQYSFSVDVWALGITAYLMLHGRYPFDATKLLPYYDRFKLLSEKILEDEPKIKTTLSADTQDLLKRMLDKNKDTRITIQNVTTHPAFN